MAVELDAWMRHLESRHMASLTFAEVSRALRALSSAYVERRQTAIPGGRVLDSAGKRAAFALYYGPLHFAALQQLLDALGVERGGSAAMRSVVDVGCGTGAAGAAIATWVGLRRVLGLDLHPWALDEARAAYACFGLDGSVQRTGAARLRRPSEPAWIVAAYVANELPETERQAFLAALGDAAAHGSTVLVVEPVSGRVAPWWGAWARAFPGVALTDATWTIDVDPPELTRRLGKAAGLSVSPVKLRSLLVRAPGRGNPVN